MLTLINLSLLPGAKISKFQNDPQERCVTILKTAARETNLMLLCPVAVTWSAIII